MSKRIIATLLLLVLFLSLNPAGQAVEADQGEEASLTVDSTVMENYSYESDTMTIRISREEIQMKSFKTTFFVAHIYLTSVEQFATAFAMDKYDTVAREDTQAIAERNGAVIAVNGDYYNHKDKVGIIIRNGQLYRDLESPRDLLIVDGQGNLRTVGYQDRVDAEKKRVITGESLMAEGVLQTFEFGPALIQEGMPCVLPEKYFIYTDDTIREPRTAIGQVEPLHYVLLVADGRRKNWSDKGMKFSEMQAILLREGCTVAYNLDGGGSTTLYFDGQVINKPAGGGQREVSDIVAFKP